MISTVAVLYDLAAILPLKASLERGIRYKVEGYYKVDLQQQTTGNFLSLNLLKAACC